MSYVASYVGPTHFLMTFRNSYGGTGIVFPVKNITGAEKTGIRRIPTGIINLG
jgi:hypothetical protein